MGWVAIRMSISSISHICCLKLDAFSLILAMMRAALAVLAYDI